MNISHAVNCKVCRKPFYVQVDESYDITGDPKKLLPMSTCNRCYDYVFSRRKAIELIFKKCSEFHSAKAGRNIDPEIERKFHTSISNYASRFCDITEAYHRRKEPEIRSGLADDLIANPNQCDDVIKAYMTAFRHASPPELIPATVDEGSAKE
jgi:hypothetical protein